MAEERILRNRNFFCWQAIQLVFLPPRSHWGGKRVVYCCFFILWSMSLYDSMIYVYIFANTNLSSISYFYFIPSLHWNQIMVQVSIIKLCQTLNKSQKIKYGSWHTRLSYYYYVTVYPFNSCKEFDSCCCVMMSTSISHLVHDLGICCWTCDTFHVAILFLTE